MTVRRRLTIWIALSAALAALAVVSFVTLPRSIKGQPPTIHGAVLSQDADPKKQLPIPSVAISVANDLPGSIHQSDASGAFNLTLPQHVRPGDFVTLRFRHPDYRPLDLTQAVADKLYIVRMVPLARKMEAGSNTPKVVVTNVLARYSMTTTTEVNVGSGVKIFEVVNTGNMPCNDQPPCSPDGKWKAAIGSASLDAGQDNEFRNARVSCIAGPCAFTKIESDGFSRGGRTISVSVRNWSDTTTFLIEAEAFHPMVSDLIRDSYPVIFGQALHFTLPQAAEGPSIEAEIDGTPITFPLGPNLCLSWASCSVKVGTDQSRAYQCELKPGYQFQ